MAKQKVVYDRNVCIGAAACAAIAPEHWEMDPENKAVLKDSKVNPKTGLFEKGVKDEAERKTLQESADVCPVAAIKIIEDKE